jgi:hypothetical protein
MAVPLLQCAKDSVLLSDFYGRKGRRLQKFIAKFSINMATVVSPEQRV